LGVNPATAAKGINVLVQKGILEKQRGMSMVVTSNAKSRLISYKQENGFRLSVSELVREAKQLDLPEDKLIAMVHEYFEGGNKDV
jgi:DNA-binding transcriptional regulator YhcF (GntR family)